MLERVDARKNKKGFRFISQDLNINSKLYRNNTELNKYPNFYYSKAEELEKTLDYIHDEKMDCCVEVKRLLYKKGQLVAYTMNFYQDYRSLKQSLKRNLSLKKEDCYKVLKVFKTLNEKKLYCRDVHLGNFLINDDDCLICDLDALKLSDDYSFDKNQCQKAIALCLAYLYRLDVVDITVLFKDCYPWIINNISINEFYRNVSNENLLEFLKFVNMTNQDEIEKSRKEMKVLIRDLRINPYFRGYYGY